MAKKAMKGKMPNFMKKSDPKMKGKDKEMYDAKMKADKKKKK